MKNSTPLLTFLLSIVFLIGFSQGNSNDRSDELISANQLKIQYGKKNNALKPSEFIKIIDDTWTTEEYLNEYQGEIETRIKKGHTFFHKEYLQEDLLGNSQIEDPEIQIISQKCISLYVGMSISKIKRFSPKSFNRTHKTRSKSGYGTVFIHYGCLLNGRNTECDSGLSLRYNLKTGKVVRINSVMD